MTLSMTLSHIPAMSAGQWSFEVTNHTTPLAVWSRGLKGMTVTWSQYRRLVPEGIGQEDGLLSPPGTCSSGLLEEEWFLEFYKSSALGLQHPQQGSERRTK